MAKYRLLTEEELQLFEKEFVDFLVVNGVTSDDWVKIKADSPEKADQMLDLFSDVVFEQVTRQIDVLHKFDTAVIQYIRCGESGMELIALKRKSPDVDLSGIDLTQLKLEATEVIRGIKSYTLSREEEVFGLLTKGYQPSTEEQWTNLSSRLLKNS